MSLSKYMASTRALAVIKDESSDYHLPKICDCRAVREAEQAAKRLASAKTTSDEMDESVDNFFGPPPAISAAPNNKTAVAAGIQTNHIPFVAPAITGDEPIGGPEHPLGNSSNPAIDEEAERLEIQQELQAYESFTKHPNDGDSLDQTEKGFSVRARVAAELFADGVDGPGAAADKLADQEDSEDEGWEPW